MLQVIVGLRIEENVLPLHAARAGKNFKE